jgi:small-conductance mechanosensitive channel
MTDLIAQVTELFEHDTAQAALRAVGIMLAGWLIAGLVGRRVAATVRAQSQLLLRRVLSGLIVGIAVAWALAELGLNLGVVLGAAGVLTVAVGFAAQTAVSNLISGLFLMVEHPFRVGDLIEVGATLGEVAAIDLLSTKLRTLDNLYVRIPNEKLLKAEVTNYTHYPIRRYDLMLTVAYQSDLNQVREVLLEAADTSRLCLQEPAPLILFQGFGESGLSVQFSVWATRDNFIQMRNDIHESVRRSFREAGIEIPFPQRTVHGQLQLVGDPARRV